MTAHVAAPPQISGTIDLLIALAGVDVGGAGGCLIVLRLFRLLRLLKMMRALPQLQLLAASLLNSLPSIVWMCVPLLVIFYIFACLGCIVFQQNDNKYFGNLWRALVTLCQVTTLDTWNQIMYIQIYGCGTYYRPQDKAAFGCDESFTGHGRWASYYFFLFIILTTYCMMNIFIGIVIQKLFESSVEMEQLNNDLSQVDGMPVDGAHTASYGKEGTRSLDVKRLINGIKRKVDVNRKRTVLLRETLAAAQ